MPRTARTITYPAQATHAGDTDGALACSFMRNGTCCDYSDDFIRRTELGEQHRAEYRAASHLPRRYAQWSALAGRPVCHRRAPREARPLTGARP